MAKKDSNNNLINDCKKYLGLPPHDTFCNPNYSDSYFYRDMCIKYTKEATDAALELLRGPSCGR